jgi:PAS domain S-box-containing protein
MTRANERSHRLHSIPQTNPIPPNRILVERTEEALRERQTKLDSILRAAPAGIGIVLNRVFAEVNPGMCQITGYKAEELVGQSTRLLFFTQEDYDAVGRVAYSSFIDHGSTSAECRWRHKSGRSVDVLLCHSLLVRGEPALGVTFVALDITERKRAVQEHEQVLRWQQGINLVQQSLLAPARLQDTLKTITDSVVRLFDADFCRVWLIRPGDLCAQGCVHAEVMEGPHVCRSRDRCLHLLASSGRYTHTDGKGHRRIPFGVYKIGRVASGENHRFLTNDVTIDPLVHDHQWARELGLVSFAGYQLRIPKGDTLGVLALYAKHPILPAEDALLDALSSALAQAIQRTQIEEALVRERELLAESSRQAGMAEVATSVLHNVGNVLNSVNISISVMKDHARAFGAEEVSRLAALLDQNRPDLPGFLAREDRGGQLITCLQSLAAHLESTQSATLRELQELARNVDHIKDVVATQQNYAKVAGLTELVKIADLVEDALGMHARALLRHDVEVIRQYDPGVPGITLEKHKLLQILVNLIQNAKYACDDCGRLDKRLTVRVSHDHAGVSIAITDNGVGIPSENLGKIFNHGFTTRKNGHGFGLHSAALAARDLGGTIAVHSHGPGQGSTFTIELPIHPHQRTT